MAIELELNGTSTPAGRFLTYAPSPARLRSVNASTALTVTLSSRKITPTGGEVVFYLSPGTPSRETAALTLPQDGSWVELAIGGKWESPSVDRDDCEIVVTSASESRSFPCMVRLRKNANALTARERDRFVSALGALNASGVYQAFRNVHVGAADAQEHGGPHFLPWHRAYLLDIERELQAIDPQVSLPYWKFDEKAPNVFNARFLGKTKIVPSILQGRSPQVEFVVGHPLAAWSVDSIAGIRRGAAFDPITQPAPGLPSSGLPMIDDATTLAFGDQFHEFSELEGTPHASAHLSFLGPINNIATAPCDPLFFLLHCNVDRLWALWQWLNKRRLPSDPDAYQEVSTAPKGMKLLDTLWPWDGDTQNGRPRISPPRIGLAPNPATAAPGSTPTLRAMIDVDGLGSAADRLGFGYDTVPFEEV